MLDVLHDDELMAEVRKIMQEFYAPLKACDADLRFVFITGITKFSQLSIFSVINNLTNVSMQPEYSAICGITENELHTVFEEALHFYYRLQVFHYNDRFYLCYQSWNLVKTN